MEDIKSQVVIEGKVFSYKVKNLPKLRLNLLTIAEEASYDDYRDVVEHVAELHHIKRLIPECVL